MIASESVYEAQSDFRASAEYHQRFDLVYLVERDLGRIKQWPLVLDETLRLLAPNGILVARIQQSNLLSLFEFACFLQSWAGGRMELVHQTALGSMVIYTTRLVTTSRRAASPDGWSFGLITDGRKPRNVAAFVRSALVLREQGLDCEVLICGPDEVSRDLGRLAEKTRLIAQPEQFLEEGWITRKKNQLVAEASRENVLVAHDRYTIGPSFTEAIREFGGDFDVLVPRQQAADGSRIPDWVMLGSELNWSTPGWLEYGDYHPWLYINGGVTIGKTSVLSAVPWNELLFWNQAEDVELTRRLQRAGVTPRLAREVVLTSGAMRPGLLEGFDRIPLLEDRYVQAPRLEWLGPANKQISPYRLGTMIDLRSDRAPLEQGAIFPSEWRWDDGLVWDDGGEDPTISVRIAEDHGDLSLDIDLEAGNTSVSLMINMVPISKFSPGRSGTVFEAIIPRKSVPASRILHIRLVRSQRRRLRLTRFRLRRAVPLPRIVIGASPTLVRAEAEDVAPLALTSGWHPVEDWGVWSSAYRSEMRLRLAPEHGQILRLECFVPYLNDGETATVALSVGQILTSVQLFDAARERQIVLLPLPPAQMGAGSEAHDIVVTLDITRLTRASAGNAVDDRMVGLGLSRVTVLRSADRSEPSTARIGELLRPASEVGDAPVTLLSGWHAPEDWGVWSCAHSAQLRVGMPGDGSLVLNMTLDVPHLIGTEEAHVSVFINDVLSTTGVFTSRSHVQNIAVKLPSSGYVGAREALIRIDISRLTLAALGNAGDSRTLGLGLRDMQLARSAVEGSSAGRA
jgi:hypothetical protein